MVSFVQRFFCTKFKAQRNCTLDNASLTSENIDYAEANTGGSCHCKMFGAGGGEAMYNSSVVVTK